MFLVEAVRVRLVDVSRDAEKEHAGGLLRRSCMVTPLTREFLASVVERNVTALSRAGA